MSFLVEIFGHAKALNLDSDFFRLIKKEMNQGR
ncbi:sporulation histidine kinase inhibitor Sda [Lentibacillus sp. CBA3610]|nr:sporulation histidine kinase inhibitor Sda [Lentibacillus sp. CBA3610]